MIKDSSSDSTADLRAKNDSKESTATETDVTTKSSRTSSSESIKNEGVSVDQTTTGGDITSSSAYINRKRTKASRACDQCRKRKIKCDYNEDRVVCSSCSKNGERCTFERVPLKRGPSKGYTRGHSRSRSISSNTGTDSNVMSNTGQDLPSPPSRPGSVLLPPLAQYLPQSGTHHNTATVLTNTSNINTTGSNSLGQQQFWKVPYHEFQQQRRGSIDSLQSDISMKSISGPPEQSLYANSPGLQNFKSPANNNNTSNNNNSSNNNNNNDAVAGYWSFIRNSNSVGGNQPQSVPPSSYPEDLDEMRRKSGSIPTILRHPSNSSVLNHQQMLYPYSQFSQQQQQVAQAKASLNPSVSSFGQFGSNGFQSRHGSITSEGMSPSAPAIYQSTPLVAYTANQSVTTPVSSANLIPSEQDQKLSTPQRTRNEQMQQQDSQPVEVNSKNQNNNGEDSDSAGSQLANKKSKRRKKSTTRAKRSGSNASIMSENSSIHPPSCSSTPTSKRGRNNGIIYGQISDVDLIDTYYEFIHIGFPIIPLNKKTLTNEILLVNTQPISSIHEINNYVILWFRNSLELLVRISLKRRYGRFFDGIGNDNNDQNNNDHDNKNESYENLEIQTVFTAALNECLQRIVDVHPKFRENKEISPKIKIIYLSTFVLLNYILAFVGYDNSFVLGMSVTIFKEFKIYELLLYDDNCIQQEDIAIEDEDDTDSHLIIFKRLYVLLVIFDSLQSCSYGGPKLLNVPIQGASEMFFQSVPENSKWAVDESPIKMECILQSIKLGEFLSELASNRRCLCDIVGNRLKWEPKEYFTLNEQKEEPISIVHLFYDLLFVKNEFTNHLLSLINLETNAYEDLTIELCLKLTNSLCFLISLILKILTLIMKLNPTNRIDYNYKPSRPIEKPSTEGLAAEPPAATTTSTPIGANNRTGNDFYQKLLGLQQGKENGFSEVMKGVISPFCISILHEIHNVTDLIKQMPTSLIGIVMTTSSNKTSDEASTKPQDLVVKLSNSMNEVVQITSLLNIIKPMKLFEQEFTAAWKYKTDDDHSSVMQKIYNRKRNGSTATSATQDSSNILANFVATGWKLLDDAELGWY